eukprot:Transcript_31056.p1 GENE.Transcript_31056~~Transcript_31056.p1  ORF type:complete len:264 (+),score=49.00 Transcript_31056:83-793(+)
MQPCATRRNVLDCTPDELSCMSQHLLDDLTAGAAALGRLACTCQLLRAVVSTLQPQVACRAVALGCAAYDEQLTLEQLAVLEAVASLCIYESEIKHGPVGAIYFTKGEARVRPGSSLDRLDQFAALLRRHPRCCCRIDAHAVGSRAQRREVAIARANAVVSALVARGVDPEAVEAVSWEDQVAGVAGWAPGGYESRRAEVSFVLDGVRLPPCPGYYDGVSEAERVWPIRSASDGDS